MRPNPFQVRNQHTSPEVADRVPDRLREAKRLRDATGMPIVACLEALAVTAGDFDAGVEVLPALIRRNDE